MREANVEIQEKLSMKRKYSVLSDHWFDTSQVGQSGDAEGL